MASYFSVRMNALLFQDGDHLEDHNVEAVDMLLKLPGVSWKNYRRIMSHVSSLYDLVNCSMERLAEILDSRYGRLLFLTFCFFKILLTYEDSFIASISLSHVAL